MKGSILGEIWCRPLVPPDFGKKTSPDEKKGGLVTLWSSASGYDKLGGVGFGAFSSLIKVPLESFLRELN
jgi:hypothetical protein